MHEKECKLKARENNVTRTADEATAATGDQMTTKYVVVTAGDEREKSANN